jgi:hypothetical protein
LISPQFFLFLSQEPKLRGRKRERLEREEVIFVSLRVILFDFSGLNLELDSINTNDPYAIGL